MMLLIGNRRAPKAKNDAVGSPAGFTLVELILVAVIIAILLGLSTPLFKKSFSDLAVKDTAFSVAKIIQYAQEMAILERNNFKIQFDFSEGSYRLRQESDPARPGEFTRIAGRFGRTFIVPQGISISGSANDIVFYPDGRCDAATVDVINREGSGYRIGVKGFGMKPDIKEVKGAG